MEKKEVKLCSTGSTGSMMPSGGHATKKAGEHGTRYWQGVADLVPLLVIAAFCAAWVWVFHRVVKGSETKWWMW